jgi:uncharacterized protein
MIYEELRNCNEKFDALCRHIESRRKVAIAFSGGVDSTFLAAVAGACLGKDAVAITVNAPYIAEWEIEEAKELTDALGIRHEFLTVDLDSTIENNPPDRCYLCKRLVFSQIQAYAESIGIETVMDGSNADDLSDYRPGMRALSELKVESPLLENRIAKDEIRTWSKAMGLDTWDKPAYACLLTRIPYDTKIEPSALKMIGDAEKVLHEMGIRGVRVRKHGMLARIEINLVEMPKILDLKVMELISGKLKDLGFEHVTLDLSGYVMGSFNKNIERGKTNE